MPSSISSPVPGVPAFAAADLVESRSLFVDPTAQLTIDEVVQQIAELVEAAR